MRKTSFLAALLLLIAPLTARADGVLDGATVTGSVRGGTLGFGPEAEVRLGSLPFGIRASVNGFGLGLNNVFRNQLRSSGGNYTYNVTAHYDADLRLLSGGLTQDYYPFRNGFRVSVGEIINGNRVTARARPTGTLQIGSATYNAGEIGEIDGTATVNTFTPYVGFGYSGTVFDRVRLMVDAGILYQGSPHVSVSASGPITTVAGFASDLERQRARIQRDVDYPIYPVLMFGVGYQF